MNGAGAGSDPTGQHLLTRSSTGTMVLRTAGAGPIAPLALASGAYIGLRIDFAVNIRYSTDATALFLDYSANGLFTDTQTVLTLGSIANTGGAAPALADLLSYEEDRWYAGQSVTLDPGTYSFTDTANIRWRSGGFANSTQILLDDIVITGLEVPTPAALSAGLALIGLAAARRRRRS